MIRLGVIGHGGRVSSFIKENVRQIGPEVRVVGIVDPDQAGRATAWPNVTGAKSFSMMTSTPWCRARDPMHS